MLCFDSGLLNLGFATFDTAGRVASVANGNGSNTRFTYDSGGNLATVLDAVGNMTQWVCDAEGQVTEEINALGDSRYYGYNQDGTLARYTDRNGRVRVYEYDGHQRVMAEIWYANAADADAAANPVNTIHFAYDDAGRITSEWDDLSSVSYVYTDSGLLAATTQAHVGGPTVVLAYAYNDAGLRTSTAATIDGVADYVDEYAYDCEGRLVAIAQYGAAGGNAVADKQITLAYNDQGLLATVTRYTDGNLAVLTQYSYDSAGRLATLVYSQGETILASYAWTYDTAADSVPSSSDQPSDINPQTSLHWLPSGGIMPGQDTTAIVDALWEGTGTPASLITEITSLDGTVSYSYDSAGQLVGATYTAGQAAEAYSYDAAGNRVTANGAAYLTGPNNQLLFDGVFSYCYDPEGNRTARFIDSNANGLLDAGDTAATTYAWDHRNRLTCVTDYATYGDPATRAVDYLYDVENRWIGRDVDSDGDGQIDSQSRFIYDGNQIVMQFDRALAPSDDPADPLAEEHLSHRYLWNPAAVDQLMADEQVTDPDVAGDIVWPLGDHQGTIRDLAVYDPATDTTAVVNHRTFDAYGNLQSQTATAIDCLFAFTARPLDQATSLQNNLHRWYDATTGRWMSEDPIGFEGKDGNPIRYCHNRSTDGTDPTGLDALPVAATVVRILAGGYIGFFEAVTLSDGKQYVQLPLRGRLYGTIYNVEGELHPFFVPNTSDLGKVLAHVADDVNKQHLVEIVLLARGTWTFYLGGDCCFKYVLSLREKILALGKEYYDNGDYEIKWEEWRITKDWSGHTLGSDWTYHMGLRIECSDGTIAYIDNGALGGYDHIFFSTDIPPKGWEKGSSATSGRPLTEDDPYGDTLSNYKTYLRQKADEFWSSIRRGIR